MQEKCEAVATERADRMQMHCASDSEAAAVASLKRNYTRQANARYQKANHTARRLLKTHS